MRKTLLLAIISLLALGFIPIWGFFAHQRINRLAVFTLPPDMIGFYKANITFITSASVTPDKRRYAVEDEAPRHYLDVDHYGDSAIHSLPHRWNDAINMHGNDTLQAYGVLPWHVYSMYLRLRDAFMIKDPAAILKISAELGHYIGDAHVPLHTTENYNGQLTGQEGIHGFWESRLPELFSGDYDFIVGKAEYIQDPQEAIWQVIESTNELVDGVLHKEKELAMRYEEKRFSFETRGKATMKVYAQDYARDYHRVLDGMVENQMRASIKMVGDFWFTAWVDAGQPNIRNLISYKPSEEELRRNREALVEWKASRFKMRNHE